MPRNNKDRRVSPERAEKARQDRIKQIEQYQFKEGNKFGKGREKGSHNVSTILTKLLDRTIKIDIKEAGKVKKSTKTYAEAIALKVIQQSLKGNMRALKILLERTEGKPLQRTEITGIGGEPIQIDQPVKLNLGSLSVEELKIIEKMFKNTDDENSITD